MKVGTVIGIVALITLGYAAASVAPQALGQMPTKDVDGELRVRYVPHPRDIRSFYKEIRTASGPATEDLWTVPADKRFIITDVFFPGFGSNSYKHVLEILDEQDQVRCYLQDFVTAGTSIHIQDTKLRLETGIPFGPGSTIRLRLTHADFGSQRAQVTVTGYLSEL